MSTRVHIVVDEREREMFRARAEAEGLSLSEWLRQAARDRVQRTALPALREPAELARFFSACDAREQRREPDWDEHRAVIEASRGEGLPSA